MSSQPAEEFQGTQRFAVVRRLGAGGMGVVFEVHDRERDQRVALKTLKHVDATAIYRFKQEFRSLAELVHPNLVPLYELISDGERWFFTMELVADGLPFLAYVRGKSYRLGPPVIGPVVETVAGTPRVTPGPAADLTETTDQPPAQGAGALRTQLQENQGAETNDQPAAADFSLSAIVQRMAEWAAPPSLEGVDFERLRRVFRQLAEGVCALHRAGKLHRDLKPGNVLVRPDGHVVLLDFGLVAELTAEPGGAASAVGQTASATSPRWTHFSTDEHIVGTIGYIAPEQTTGELLTPASDWYAVGVMLFQTITGRLPFRGAPSEVVRDKQLGDGPAPADLLDGVPEDLNALCTALLRHDPEARPSGSDVLARLSGAPAEESAEERVLAVEPLPFVGRQTHLAELSGAFDNLLKGRAVVYHVHGESGAGKSALVQHFLDRLAQHRDVVILAGRCYEQESVPYKEVDNLVDALTRYLLRLSRPFTACPVGRPVPAWPGSVLPYVF